MKRAVCRCPYTLFFSSHYDLRALFRHGVGTTSGAGEASCKFHLKY